MTPASRPPILPFTGPRHPPFSDTRLIRTLPGADTPTSRRKLMPRATPRATLAVLAVLLAAPALPAQPPQYSVAVIAAIDPAPPAGPISLPLGLNNNGRVVGYSYTNAGQIHALNWRNGTTMQLSGLSSYTQTFANRVNLLGRIAGTGYRLNNLGQ